MLALFDLYFENFNKITPKWNYHHFKKKTKKSKKKGK